MWPSSVALLRARPPSYPAAAGLHDRTPAPPAYAVAPSVGSEATTARGEQAGRRNPRAATVAHRGPPPRGSGAQIYCVFYLAVSLRCTWTFFASSGLDLQFTSTKAAIGPEFTEHGVNDARTKGVRTFGSTVAETVRRRATLKIH